MSQLARFLVALVVIAVVAWWWMRGADPASTAAAPGSRSEPERWAPVDVAAPRVEADAARGEVAPSAASLATPTVLALVCVYDDDGAPLAGLEVCARKSQARSWSFGKASASHAALGEGALTDAQGRAELEVESGAELKAYASSEAIGLRTESVAPLAPGERRELVVRVPRPKGLVFRGRVVDAQTGAAPPGAFVRAEGRRGMSFGGSRGSLPRRPRAIALREGGEPIEAAPDGSFEISFKEFEHGLGLASAPGYSPILFPLGAGRENPERALVVRVSRAASLAVTVLECAGVPLADADVVARTDSWNVVQSDDSSESVGATQDPVWVERTDRAGFAELRDVAPGVPLQLIVHVKGRDSFVASQTLALEPGERREHEVVLGGAATLSGRAWDEEGRPVAGLAVGCAPAHRECATFLRDSAQGLRTTKTDEQGAFRFEHVEDGLWWVGTLESPRAPDAPRALAPPVRVASGSAGDVELRVARSLRIEGVVQDPTGAAVAQAFVHARLEGSMAFLSARTDGEGRFALGPLPRGAWTLSTQANMTSGFAPSEDVVAAAGATGVTLRLRAGGSLAGRVVDAAGGSVSGMVTLAANVEPSIWSTSLRGDAFEFRGLLPGDYSVALSLSDGRCGLVSGLRVEAGQSLTDVELVLGRGARVVVRNDDGAELVSFQVRVDGCVVKSDGLPAGDQAELWVPPGAFELRWFQWPAKEPVGVERAELAVGDEREFRWTKPR